MDTRFVSTFCLLWVMLLWTWVYKYFFETLILIILGIYPKGLMEHRVILFFEELPYFFPTVATLFYTPINIAQSSSISTSSLMVAIFLFFFKL